MADVLLRMIGFVALVRFEITLVKLLLVRVGWRKS